MPPEAEPVRDWLVKAHTDLRLARLALGAVPAIHDGACFHCQQAAEKALKGLLRWHGLEPPKTHALGPLLDLSAPLTTEFTPLRADLLALSYYAVVTRDPIARDPDARDAEQALRVAEQVYDTVLRLLPGEVHP